MQYYTLNIEEFVQSISKPLLSATAKELEEWRVSAEADLNNAVKEFQKLKLLYPFENEVGEIKKPSQLSQDERDKCTYVRTATDRRYYTPTEKRLLGITPNIFNISLDRLNTIAETGMLDPNEPKRFSFGKRMLRKFLARKLLKNNFVHHEDRSERYYEYVSEATQSLDFAKRAHKRASKRLQEGLDDLRSYEAKKSALQKLIKHLQAKGYEKIYLTDVEYLRPFDHLSALTLFEQKMRSEEKLERQNFMHMLLRAEPKADPDFISKIETELRKSRTGTLLLQQAKEYGVRILTSSYPSGVIPEYSAAATYDPNKNEVVLIKDEESVPDIEYAYKLAHELRHAWQANYHHAAIQAGLKQNELIATKLLEADARAFHLKTTFEILGIDADKEAEKKGMSAAYLFVGNFLDHSNGSVQYYERKFCKILREAVKLETCSRWQQSVSDHVMLQPDFLRKFLVEPDGKPYVHEQNFSFLVESITKIDPRILEIASASQSHSADGNITTRPQPTLYSHKAPALQK